MRFFLTFLKRAFQLIGILIVFFLIYGAWFYRDIPREIPSDVKLWESGPSTIAYKAAGLEYNDKTPVVMIHAMFYHMGQWDDWADEISKSRPVYRFDVAGHGLSSLDQNEDYSLQATIKTLHDFLELHQLEKAILVGASMGGATNFNYAATNPERVEKLILVNSGGLEGFDEEGSATAPEWIYWILRYLPDFALDSFVDWTAAGNDTGDAFRAEFKQIFRTQDVRKGILGRMQDFKSPTTREVLPQITTPTLIMWGDLNPQLPVEQASEFKHLIEQGGAEVTLKTYKTAGHVLSAEKIEGATEDLIKFINDGAL